MVTLDTDNEDGLDIAIYWKVLLFVPLFLSFYPIIEFYRRKPFLSFYLFTWIFVGFPLWLYSGLWENEDPVTLTLIIAKQFMIAGAFVGISIWRISCIADDDFSAHFSGFKLNEKLHGALKGNRFQRFWQNFVPIIFFVNIAWAVLVLSLLI